MRAQEQKLYSCSNLHFTAIQTTLGLQANHGIILVLLRRIKSLISKFSSPETSREEQKLQIGVSWIAVPKRSNLRALSIPSLWTFKQSRMTTVVILRHRTARAESKDDFKKDSIQKPRAGALDSDDLGYVGLASQPVKVCDCSGKSRIPQAGSLCHEAIIISGGTRISNFVRGTGFQPVMRRSEE